MIQSNGTTDNLSSRTMSSTNIDRCDKANNAKDASLVTPQNQSDWKKALQKFGGKPDGSVSLSPVDQGLETEQELVLEISSLTKQGVESEKVPELQPAAMPVVQPVPLLQKEFELESELKTQTDELSMPAVSINPSSGVVSLGMTPEPFVLNSVEVTQSTAGSLPSSLVDVGTDMRHTANFGQMAKLQRDLPEVAIKFQSEAFKGTEMQLSKQGGAWQLIALCNSGATAESIRSQSSVLVQRFSQKQHGKLEIDVLIRSGEKRPRQSNNPSGSHKDMY